MTYMGFDRNEIKTRLKKYVSTPSELVDKMHVFGYAINHIYFDNSMIIFTFVGTIPPYWDEDKKQYKKLDVFCKKVLFSGCGLSFDLKINDVVEND